MHYMHQSHDSTKQSKQMETSVQPASHPETSERRKSPAEKHAHVMFG